MLLFPKGYFKDEERGGFLVDADMKCAWAAQLEVLKVIESICDKYSLKYYAFYGTLLGAVRHNGFVPWDDDMDIAMLRDDYDIFIKVAGPELPTEYLLLNSHYDEYTEAMASRVTNSDCVNANQAFLIKNHGCPYMVGVDIFPIDYVPVNEDKRIFQKDKLEYIMSLAETILKDDNTPDNKQYIDDCLSSLEHTFGFEFDKNGNILSQLFCLFDFIAASYGNINNPVYTVHSGYVNVTKSYHSLWFSDIIELGFEVDTVKAPIGLEAILNITYGNNFMMPVKNAASHSGLYNRQKSMLMESGLYEKVVDARNLMENIMCFDNIELASEGEGEPFPDELIDRAFFGNSENGIKRKVILYALNSASLMRFGEKTINKIESALNTFKHEKTNIAVILTEDITFLATFNAMYPELYKKYELLRQSVIDDDCGVIGDSLYYDYVSVCSAYYGDGTSAMGAFMKAQKPIMIQNYDIC